MAKNTMNIAKGVGAGLVAGLMFGFVGSVMMKDTKQSKKKSAKALEAVETIWGDVQEFFK